MLRHESPFRFVYDYRRAFALIFRFGEQATKALKLDKSLILTLTEAALYLNFKKIANISHQHIDQVWIIVILIEPERLKSKA